MANDDPGPEWVISSCLPTTSTDSTSQEELLRSARCVWPHVHAHANRELGDRRDDPENVTLAAEVWEGVLQSIARSLHLTDFMRRNREHGFILDGRVPAPV